MALITISFSGTTNGTSFADTFVIDSGLTYVLGPVAVIINGKERIDLVKLAGADLITNGPINLTLKDVEKLTGSSLNESVKEASYLTGIDNHFYGEGGNDTLEGGFGNDILDGGTGFNDRLFGGEGNDEIDDPDGINAAHGGQGDDLIDVTFASNWGNRSDGKITGGYGNDNINVTINNAAFFINLKGDEPYLNTPQDGDDQISLLGLYGNAVVDLGGGNDIFYGNSGKDLVTAGDGDDLVNTDNNNDNLLGQGGRDVLVGGIGTDGYTGGADADLFVSYWQTETNFTTVTDFVDGVDQLSIVTNTATNTFLTDASQLQVSLQTIKGVQGVKLSYSGKDLFFLQGVTNTSLIDNSDLFATSSSAAEDIATDFWT